MAHKAYFFAAGATQKSTLHSRAVRGKCKKDHDRQIRCSLTGNNNRNLAL
jgi:hypothetical protein